MSRIKAVGDRYQAMRNTISGRITLLALTSFLVGIWQFVFTGTLDQVAASVGVSVATAGAPWALPCS